MYRIVLAAALAGFTGTGFAAPPPLPAHAAPARARVYIISPADGATVGPEVTVRFGLAGMGVAPAGVEKQYTGHHHLLIDVASLPASGQPIPSDANHRHFGGGQTEAVVKLSPGTHILQLELGDAHHVPFEPRVVSKAITIHVR